MQPVDGLGAGSDQIVAVFHYRAQGGDGLVHYRGLQAGRGHGGDADRYRVGVIVLATVAGRERTHAGGQFCWHINDIDVVGVQTRRKRSAESAGSFHAPRRVRPAAGEASQLPVAVPADRNPQRRQRLQLRVHRGRGPRRFVWIDRDHDLI
nr:hypothetical protein [Amycolatopsis palatopharyngis]